MNQWVMKTYADSDAFANGIEAQLPAEGSIARGWQPYEYPDTNEGYEMAKAELQFHLLQRPQTTLPKAKNSMVFTALFVTEKKETVKEF